MDCAVSRSTKTVWPVLALSLMIGLAGCATPALDSGGPGASAESKGTPASYSPKPGLSAKQRLRQAIGLLETGDADAARSELILYLQEKPDGTLARDLLQQIDMPIEQFFPPDYREIVLASGQSLSTVAKQYLGSAYLFHALARYNGITEPRKVGAGRSIRVPLTEQAIAAFNRDDTGQEIEAPTAMPAEQPAAEPLAEPELEPEEELTDGTEQAESPAPTYAELEKMHRQALNAYRAQDLDRAIGLWDQVLAADPNFENASIYRSQAIELQEKLRKLK